MCQWGIKEKEERGEFLDKIVIKLRGDLGQGGESRNSGLKQEGRNIFGRLIKFKRLELRGEVLV